MPTKQQEDTETLYDFCNHIEASSIVQAYAFNTGKYLLDSTLRRTGTYFLNAFHHRFRDAEGITNIDDQLSIREELVKSEKAWLNVDIKDCNNVTQTIKLLIEHVKFEIEYFGILRLDDHLCDLDLVFESDETLREQSYQLFFEEMQKVVKGKTFFKRHPMRDHINIVQFPFSHSIAFEFCEKNNLLNKTNLFPAHSNIVMMVQYYQSAIEHHLQELRTAPEGQSNFFTVDALAFEVGNIIAFLTRFVDYLVADDDPCEVQKLDASILEKLHNEIRELLVTIEKAVPYVRDIDEEQAESLLGTCVAIKSKLPAVEEQNVAVPPAELPDVETSQFVGALSPGSLIHEEFQAMHSDGGAAATDGSPPSDPSITQQQAFTPPDVEDPESTDGEESGSKPGV